MQGREAKRYTLTWRGRNTARKLAGEEVAEEIPESQPSLEYLYLRRAMRTEAWQLWRVGSKRQITWDDAWAFWGVSPDSTPEQIAERLAWITTALRSLEEAADARNAGHLHGWLQERFQAYLRIAGRRKKAVS